MLDPDEYKKITKAIRDPDNWVISFHYRKKDSVAIRVVSPIKRFGAYLEAWCLHSGEPRRFRWENMAAVNLAPASEFLAPLTLVEYPAVQ